MSGSEFSERQERARLEEVYSGYRANNSHESRWSRELVGNRLILDERSRYLEGAFGASAQRVLDLGCGSGGDAGDLLQGGLAEFVVGVDLQGELLRTRAASLPESPSILASGSSLPFRSNSFDAIIISTLFSSVLDRSLRRAIAAEALRVLKEGGNMYIYDMRVFNPANHAIRPLTLRQIRSMFGRQIKFSQAVTLIPQVARRLSGPQATLWYSRLTRTRLARSHRFTVVTKQSS